MKMYTDGCTDRCTHIRLIDISPTFSLGGERGGGGRGDKNNCGVQIIRVNYSKLKGP